MILCDSKNDLECRYTADFVSWDEHESVEIFAPNAEVAREMATTVAAETFPELFDFVRLWGEGKLLWTVDEGWLPEHDAF